MSVFAGVDDQVARHPDAHAQAEPGAIALLGVPYDLTASYKRGARLGPAAIRGAAPALEDWSARWRCSLEQLRMCDLGDLIIDGDGPPLPVVQATRDVQRELLERRLRPLLLGGEHNITAGAVWATLERHPDLLVVQLDAHADLRQDFAGEPHSHACAMRRCLDELPADALLQVGIRSATRQEQDELDATGRGVAATAPALAAALAAAKAGPDRPIYLTVDLDVFDPSVLPGTGSPDPGGIDWLTFEALLGTLRGHRIVAADVMELAPELDPSGVSSVVAAKVVRDIALFMAGLPS